MGWEPTRCSQAPPTALSRCGDACSVNSSSSPARAGETWGNPVGTRAGIPFGHQLRLAPNGLELLNRNNQTRATAFGRCSQAPPTAEALRRGTEALQGRAHPPLPRSQQLNCCGGAGESQRLCYRAAPTYALCGVLTTCTAGNHPPTCNGHTSANIPSSIRTWKSSAGGHR